jgi:hypothetical protein
MFIAAARRRRPMHFQRKRAGVIRFGWAAIALVPLLAGCSSLAPKEADQQTLSLACQVTPCVCRATTTSFWAREAEAKPVQFRSDGTAACPDGYRLERKASSGRRSYS